MYLVYYIIECNYVGMCKNLNKRKITHRSRFLNTKTKEYNKKLYQYMRDNNLDINSLNFKILRKDIPEKREAEMYETMFMIFYNSIDNGTNCQWSWMNEKVLYEKQKEKSREYKNIHKERLREYKNEKINCPICNLKLSRSSLKRHKKRKH